MILSHDFWVRHFGSDPTVVDRTIPQPGLLWHVVGIAAPNAQLLFPPRTNVERAPDVWIASRTNFATATRTSAGPRVIARMKPGVTLAQAQQQMDGLAAELRNTYVVKKNAGVYINAVSMHDTLVSDVRISILALMGAVTFVLLIACANLANLTMTQSARRERDLAVRTALGAGRATLVRQMLVESVVLAVVGAAAGLALARIGIVVLQQIGPANLPRLQHVAIDWRVLTFTALAAMTSVVLFGVLPAFKASRPDVVEVLRRSGRTTALGSGRLRSGLVVVEVALTFVLLVGSGLMLRSLVVLQHVDPGYDPNGVLTFLVPNFNGPTAEARAEFVRRMQAEIGALPGVKAVAGAQPLPLDGTTANMPYGTEATAPDQFQQAAIHTVQVGYFEAMKAKLIEGRVFTEQDNRIDGRSIVIDRLLAARAFPGESAVGKRLMLRLGGNNPVPYEVIGVVQHQRHATLAADGREALFFLDGQRGFGSANRWIVRSDGDPVQLVSAVKAAIAQDRSHRRRRRHAADVGLRRSRPGANALRAGADLSVRGDRRGACGRRSLRRALDRRPSAYRRDRRPARVWCRAQGDLQPHRRPRPASRLHRRRHRRRRRVRHDAPDSDDAGGRAGDRSDDVRLDRGDVPRGRGGGVRDSGVPSVEAGSDGRAAGRVELSELGTRLKLWN